MDKFLYFEKIGEDVSNITNINEILNKLKLDYIVESQNIFLENGIKIPNKYANVRTDTNEILGIVGKNYQIVQNNDGFSFLNDLFSLGLKFVNAGALNDNCGVFVVMKGSPVYLGDFKAISYILFSNNFDGSGAIKVEFTPVIEEYKNVLLLTNSKIPTKITIKHCKQSKNDDFNNEILSLLNNYLEYLNKITLKLNKSKQTLNNVLTQLVPITSKMTNILKIRAEDTRAEINEIYNSLNNIEDNCFKIILAVSIYESHREPLRDTNNNYIYLDRVVSGMPLTNKALSIILGGIL